MAMPNKLREKLAQQFLEALNEGQLPWKACWQQRIPANGITGKAYRGVNSFLLSIVAELEGYFDPRWCTFRQASEKGWHIQKGAKGVPVEYWAYYDRLQKKLLTWSEANQLQADPIYAQQNLQLRSRTYTVFNARQIEGMPELPKVPAANIAAIRQQRDTLLRNMDLKYREGGGRAYYSPVEDRVTLPREQDFFDIYSYTCTFLHECGHATGHPTRLGRDLSGEPGSDSYAKEELRAEIASAFAAQAIGLQLTDEQLQNHMNLHKAYIQSWAENLKDAPEELFRAIKDAEKISDYLIEKGEFAMVHGQQLEKAELETASKEQTLIMEQEVARTVHSSEKLQRICRSHNRER